jgi:hypothetical protein
MEPDQVITLNPVSHPDRQVRRIGFELTDPYVEQCWAPLIGPSSTMLLRRLPELWSMHEPAEMEAKELSRSIGLGVGMGKNSPLVRTLDRLVRFRFARPGPSEPGLDVYTEVAPLGAHELAKVPQWSRDAHARLLDAHLEQFNGLSEHQAKIAAATARLDRVQHGHDRAPTASAVIQKSLGR